MTEWRPLLFRCLLGLAHLFAWLGCLCSCAGDSKILYLLAFLDGSGKPAGLEASAGPGLGRIVRVAVLRRNGTASATTPEALCPTWST
jgi:hypothetical protein